MLNIKLDSIIETKILIKYTLIVLPIVFYCIYTIRYSFTLSKNIFLNRQQKIINLILIWIMPVIWILFLKAYFKPIPGSHQVKKKKDRNVFTESGLGILENMSDNHSIGNQ